MRAVLMLLLLAAPACSQDWSGFRGANRDGKLAGFKAPESWPKELQKGWQVEVGEGMSSPALVDGKIYLHARQGGDEAILCLEASSGKQVWKNTYAVAFDPESPAKNYGKGPFSSPTVADGKVYAFGITGILSCLDARDGKVVWRNDFRDAHPKPYPMWGTGLSPLVAGGLCVVHVGREGKGTVFALNAADGKPKWSWEGDGPSYASPILAMVGGKSQLITQTEFNAVGLSPADGKLLWKVEFKTGYEQNSVTPVVIDNLVILSGTGIGIKAYKIDGDKPEVAWETTEVSLYMCTPVLKGDRLYGLNEKRLGQYFCLDAKTGKTLWSSGARQGTNAALIDAGDVILSLATMSPEQKKPSSLVVFEAGDKAFAEKARYVVSDRAVFAHPVVSGKSIIVKESTQLTQWTLP